jgi:hypothetical protein
MPFLLRPFRRFSVQCPGTYHAAPFKGHGMIRKLSYIGCRLSNDIPIQPEKTVSS